MSTRNDRCSPRRGSRGLSLVELIMFIVIVGAAVAGIIGVISVTTQSSADPMIRKQALAIAEAFLEEVQLQPFTYCDPDDPGAATASMSGGAIAIGTIASTAGTGGSTVDVTGVNLSGRNAVVVFVGYENRNGNEVVSSVRIDPTGANVTVPELANINHTLSGGDDGRIYVFGLVNPPQGTYTIRVTFNTSLASSAGRHVVVYPLSGVDTAAPFRTPGTNMNDSASGNVTVPSAVGDLVLAGLTGETIGSSTVAAPAVEDYDTGSGSCSGGECNNHLATAQRAGAATSVNFSWSHANDHWAAAGVSVKPGGGCPMLAESIGPEPSETRYSAVSPFDNVNDYHGFDSNTASPSGIRNIDSTAIAGLEGYRVTVSVASQTLGGIGNDINGNPQSLLVTVTVTGPGNTTVTLHGYRTRYAPNALP